MLAICLATFAVAYRLGSVGNLDAYDDNTPAYRAEHAIRGASTLLLWLRFTRVFTVMQSTGPLLLMVYRMVRKDIGKYVVLQTLLVRPPGEGRGTKTPGLGTRAARCCLLPAASSARPVARRSLRSLRSSPRFTAATRRSQVRSPRDDLRPSC